MAEDEDDYLSDKFLANAASTSPQPRTYAQLRKEAVKQAKLKNEQNKLKSRRQREIESREEGLKKSLFERAKEEEISGISSGSKALSIMMKMGFRPGESLGKVDNSSPGTRSSSPPSTKTYRRQLKDGESEGLPSAVAGPSDFQRHKIEPLPINEWAGKKGIGLSKRPRSPSPTSAERVAKMVKMAEDAHHSNFRDRARGEYQERQAEGRLGPVQRTCITLDEKAGKMFNVLWLDPKNPGSFPTGLIESLSLYPNFTVPSSKHERHSDSLEARLRLQIRADALSPDINQASVDPSEVHVKYPLDILEEATQFLRLDAQDRLQLVLSYLREKYAYCFWCGTQYSDDIEMLNQCLGPDEQDHD